MRRLIHMLCDYRGYALSDPAHARYSGLTGTGYKQHVLVTVPATPLHGTSYDTPEEAKAAVDAYLSGPAKTREQLNSLKVAQLAELLLSLHQLLEGGDNVENPQYNAAKLTKPVLVNLVLGLQLLAKHEGLAP